MLASDILTELCEDVARRLNMRQPFLVTVERHYYIYAIDNKSFYISSYGGGFHGDQRLQPPQADKPITAFKRRPGCMCILYGQRINNVGVDRSLRSCLAACIGEYIATCKPLCMDRSYHAENGPSRQLRVPKQR